MTASAPRRLWTWAGLILAAVTALVAVQVGLAAAGERKATRIAAAEGLDLRYQAGPLALEPLGPLGAGFDVTREGMALLAPTAGGLAGIGADGGPEILSLKTRGLAGFALDGQDNLITVAGGFLGRLTETGEALEAVPLPYDDARLAGSVHDGAVYLYGGRDGDWRLYRFWENGRFEVLLSSPQPLVGVADTGSAVYVATARAIHRLGGDGARPVFRAPAAPGWGPITSVAVTPDGQVLFATPHRVWIVAAGGAASLINDAGGQIRLRGGRVHVFDPERRLLFSFAPRKG